MRGNNSPKMIALAATLGAVGGGFIVAIVTRALPKLMSQMMTNMMGVMMTQIGGESCNPEEM